MEKKIWNAGDSNCLVEMPAFIRDNFRHDRHFVQIELGTLADESQTDSRHKQLEPVLLSVLETDLALKRGKDFTIETLRSGRHTINLLAREAEKKEGLFGRLAGLLGKNGKNAELDTTGAARDPRHDEVVGILLENLKKRLGEYVLPKLYAPHVELKSLNLCSGSEYKQYFSALVSGNTHEQIDRYYRDKILEGMAEVPRFHVDAEFHATIVCDESKALCTEFGLVDFQPPEKMDSDEPKAEDMKPERAKPEIKREEAPPPPVKPSPPPPSSAALPSSARVAIYFGSERLGDVGGAKVTVGWANWRAKFGDINKLSDPRFLLIQKQKPPIWTIEPADRTKAVRIWADGSLLDAPRPVTEGMRLSLGNSAADEDKYPLLLRKA